MTNSGSIITWWKNWVGLVATLAVATLVLLPFPVVGILHAESSAAVASVAFFATGVTAVRFFRNGVPLSTVLKGVLIAALVPLALLTLSLLWRANCGYATGLLLYAVFVFPSVLFAASLSMWCEAHFRRPTFWFVSLGIITLVSSVVFDFGFHPQFYTYNHVFGAVLGPVYDEELAIRPNLFLFRAVTLLIAAVLVWDSMRVVASRVSARRSFWTEAGKLSSYLGVLLISFWSSDVLGLVTSYEQIDSVLTRSETTDNFVIHFEPGSLSESEVSYFLAQQEYRYSQLSDIIGVEVEQPIHVYVYPDARTKGRLTGAMFTSVTPVWLNRPQIHILSDEFNNSFSHELVHVFGREFGLPIVNANLSIGLVEGLAVALEAPDGLPSIDSQVSAAYKELEDPVERLSTDASRVTNPLGFWTGRGAVSYSLAGSYVAFLIEKYGVGNVMTAYGSLSARRGLDGDSHDVAREWASALIADSSTSESARMLALARFSRPSLFEKRCPHFVSRDTRLLRSARVSLDGGDTLTATTLLSNVSESSVQGRYLRASLKIAAGEYAEAIDVVADTTSLPLVLLHHDARALAGGSDDRQARSAYQSLMGRIPDYALNSRASIGLRLADDRLTELRDLYRPQPSRCDSTNSNLTLLACYRLLLDKKDYAGAAQAISRISLEPDTGSRQQIETFVLISAAQSWLVAGSYGRAQSAFGEVRKSEYVRTRPELSQFVDDRLGLVAFARNNN